MLTYVIVMSYINKEKKNQEIPSLKQRKDKYVFFICIVNVW